MKRIGVVSLDSIDNIGEELLRHITEVVIGKIGVNVKSISLDPSYRKIGILRAVTSLLLFGIASLFKGDLNFKISMIAYRIRLTKYFTKEFSGLDGIVIAVGMMKFSTQNFSFIFSILAGIATGMLTIPPNPLSAPEVVHFMIWFLSIALQASSLSLCFFK